MSWSNLRLLAMDAISAAKIRAVYERPGTPGEKAAALSALKRRGIDPSAKAERVTLRSGYSPWPGGKAARDASEEFQPAKITDGDVVPTHKGYVYHVTTPSRMNSIKQKGLLPKRPPPDMGSWDDGTTEKRIYFSENPNKLTLPSKEFPWRGSPKGSVLRHPIGPHVRPDQGGVPGDLISKRPIESHELEYLHKSGAWKPLSG